MLVLLGTSPFVDAAAQGRRVALVVGADRYEHLTGLTNSVADARAVAERLRRGGFEVIGPVIDPSLLQFNEAIDRFGRQLSSEDVGLFFFAGHALGVGGSNLLLPVDTPQLISDRELRARSVNLSDVLNDMLSRARAAIVLIDAAREHALPRDATASQGAQSNRAGGLRDVAPARSDAYFVMFAAQPGAATFDRVRTDNNEPNSLFTRHLLRVLDEQPNRPLAAQMRQVRDDVARAARAAGFVQVPHIDDRMIGSGSFLLTSPFPTPSPGQGIGLPSTGQHSRLASVPPVLAQPVPPPVPPATPILQDRRVALVIGNATYRAPGVARLANPHNDARAMAALFREIGFHHVALHLDLDRAATIETLMDFEREAERADWATIYFAGHGIEINGVNHLIPVDARLRSDRDVPDETVPLERVLARIDRARRLRLVILDACRDNPFLASMQRPGGTRSINRGLGRVQASEIPAGTLIAFAAGAGQVAEDGTGENSPFVQSLVRRMREPNVEINRMFRRVRADVLTATGGRQAPMTSEALGDEDLFLRRENNPASGTLSPQPFATPPLPAPRENADGLFWQSIQASRNPTDFENYLSRFPNGMFAQMARARIEELRAAGTGLQSLQLRPPPPPGQPELERAQAAQARRDFAQAWRLYTQIAEAGHPEAFYSMAVMLRAGQGRDANPEAAARIFLAAAEQGHADAMTSLASMHRRGEGIPRDPQQAIRWYREAARLDHINASYRLALMYEQADGVLRDRVEAYMWLLVAAGRSPEPARLQARLERELTDQQRREAELRLARWRATNR